MTNICVFGDSIAYGANDSKTGGYINLLKCKLLSKDIFVYNLSICGESTDDLVSRLEKECTERDPDVIIIALGINDSSYNKSKKNTVSLKDYENNLKKILTISKKFTKEVIFLGLTYVDETKTKPVNWNKDVYYNNENIFEYNQVIENFSRKNKVMFIELNRTITISDLADGIHPNSKGHKKIFDKINKIF